MSLITFQELNKNKIGVSELSLELVAERSNPVIQEAIRRNSGLVLDPSLGSPPLEKEYNPLPHPVSFSLVSLEGPSHNNPIDVLILSYLLTIVCTLKYVLTDYDFNCNYL